jgi:AcrR family transcriptional regulator
MNTDVNISRKEQIIKVSSRLFKEKGYMGTSMRDIAGELDIEAASLYSHIKSKDEILDEICFTKADELIKSMEEINDIYFNAEEKLRMAVKAHVKILCNDLDDSSVFLHEWRHLDKPRKEEFKMLRNRYEGGFRKILQDGEDENIFETVDKKFASLTILSTLNWITEWYKPEGPMSPEEVGENLCNFILTGLKKKSST